MMPEFNLQELSSQEKEYLIIKPCKILQCFSSSAAISTLPAFIVSYLKHSLCSVYVHLHLFLTKNKLKRALEQYNISLEYHKTA